MSPSVSNCPYLLNMVSPASAWKACRAEETTILVLDCNTHSICSPQALMVCSTGDRDHCREPGHWVTYQTHYVIYFKARIPPPSCVLITRKINRKAFRKYLNSVLVEMFTCFLCVFYSVEIHLFPTIWWTHHGASRFLSNSSRQLFGETFTWMTQKIYSAL